MCLYHKIFKNLTVFFFDLKVPLLDTILSAIYVESKRRWEWWKAAAVCCVTGFVLGALCMLPVSENFRKYLEVWDQSIYCLLMILFLF